MARRVTANLSSIIFPPSVTPPIEIKTDDLSLVVNTSAVALVLGRHNRQDDIELVQFYLSEFFDTVPGIPIPTNFPRSKSGELVKVDGVMGRQTNAAILLYQQKVLSLTRGLGVVTPPIADGPSLLGSGPSVQIVSFTQARTILTLAATWVQFHPGTEILDSPKLGRAVHLRTELTRGIPQPL